MEAVLSCPVFFLCDVVGQAHMVCTFTERNEITALVIS